MGVPFFVLVSILILPRAGRFDRVISCRMGAAMLTGIG